MKHTLAIIAVTFAFLLPSTAAAADFGAHTTSHSSHSNIDWD